MTWRLYKPSPRGEDCDTRNHPLKRRRSRPCESIRSPSTVIPSAAEGSLLHCRHMHTCTLTQTTPWCFPLSPFSHSRFTGLQKRIPPLSGIILYKNRREASHLGLQRRFLDFARNDDARETLIFRLLNNWHLSQLPN